MNNRPFNEPVMFMRSSSLIRRVSNTDAALYFLEHKWPFEDSETREKACSVCRQVMKGKANPSEARYAFIRALEEADFDVIEIQSAGSSNERCRDH